ADAARKAESEAERKARTTELSLIAAQDDATKSARAAAERASRLASLEAEIRRLEQARSSALESERDAERELSDHGDGGLLTKAAADARANAAQARTEDSEARAALDILNREHDTRGSRLASLAEDRGRWQSRREAAIAHVAELDRRREELTRELFAAEAVPGEIAAKRSGLLDAISTAETARNEAADVRSKAESRPAEADKQAKAADPGLSAAPADP